MQRKNNILKSSRSGFAMIMAIAVIVIIATIMALSLALTSQTTKRTGDLYIYEQAVLLSKSAQEYALLRIAQDGPCTHQNDLNFNPDLDYDGTNDYYNIDIQIRYAYTAPFPAGCGTQTITINTPEQNGSVIIDVAVSVNDATISSERIRYFRRSVNKL